MACARIQFMRSDFLEGDGMDFPFFSFPCCFGQVGHKNYVCEVLLRKIDCFEILQWVDPISIEM